MDDMRKIDALFAPFAGHGKPGCAVLVMRGGQTVYSKGFGVANLETGAPITPHTVFHVASLTKQFTAMCITLLEEDGALSVQESIRKYLPWMPAFDCDIKIHHLLHHTSGLREQWDMFTLSGNSMEDLATGEHIMRLLSHQKKLNFTPGEKYQYCNSGYTLLAQIVEAVSGKSIRDFAQERIFAPLGMTSTFYRDDHGELCAKRAHSYRPSAQGGWREYTLSFDIVGSTGLNTTISDLAKWFHHFRHPTICSSAAISRMTQPVALADGSASIYRRGVKCYDYCGMQVREHTGSNAGYRALTISAGEIDIAILSNDMYAHPILRGFHMLDILCGIARERGRGPEVYCDMELTPAPGRYCSGRSILDIGGDKNALTLDDGAIHHFTRVRGNWFICAQTACELYVTPTGFTYFDSPAPAAYVPLKALPLDAQAQKALAGYWYSRELQSVYEAAASAKELVFTHMKAGGMRFVQTAPNVFLCTNAPGTGLVYDDGRLLASKNRSQNIEFKRMPDIP